MAFKNIPLTIDTMIRNPEPIEGINQEDNVELNIVVTENKTPKDLSGQTIKVYVRRIDGTLVEQTNQITPTNARKGEVTVKLKNSAFNKEGYTLFQLDVSDSSGRITSSYATFKIGKGLASGEAIANTNEIEALKKVEEYIKKANQELETFNQTVAEINENEATRQENEVVRVKGEASRNKAEAIRVQQEATRKEKENERVRLESIRTTEEADRIKAEAERKEAENNRKVAESNRKLAENTRKTNEAARVEAELNRQSLFEENEEIRNENENLRIEAEKERKLTFSNNNKFESERVEAEKLRAIAEDKRVTAEKARAKAEEERVKAETRRENTYTDFNDSEAERRNNEANRVRAEAERVNAESGRNERFNTNEEKRNSTFIESERTRERAFNEAQSNRNEAFEESERVREEAFKVSEVTRNEAEEGRVAAELLRVEAEKLRVAGEENRNNTFTQSEEERQVAFEEAENNRKVAESKRIEAESVRVEAEKLRVAAETGRIRAESLRVAAEEERVAAETKREEGFNKFESKINANTKELKNARTAITGEKFNSLDERIDCEVDRLNKKIEVSFLHQEDKESHDINNTVEGMTTDMVIKGRTLQNVMPELNKSNFNFTGETNLVDGFFVIPFGVDVNASLIGANRKKTILKPNTKYTVIADILENNTGQKLGMSSYGCSFVPSKNSFDNSVGISMITGTTKDNFNNVEIKTDFLFCIWGNGGDLSKKIKFKAMVLEGDWTNKPIPEYFEGIKSFGQEENKISILTTGKNRFDKNQYSKFLKGDTLEFKVDGNDRTNNFFYIYTKRDSSSEPILRGFDTSAKEFSTLNQEKYYTLIGINGNKKDLKIWGEITLSANTTHYFSSINDKDSNTVRFTNVQIVEGTKKVPYESYQEDKKDVLLSKYGFDEGLRGINDVQDELNSTENLAIKKIEKYIPTGNENIYLDATRDNTIAFNFKYNEGYKKGKNNNTNFICDILPTELGCFSSDIEGVFGSSNGFFGSILKNKLETQDIEGVKKYVKSNLKYCYYELAEPIETPLDENINLKTFGERTYVSFENAISGTSSFEAPVDAATTISRLNRENRALEEENRSLRQDFESTTLSLTDSDLELVKQNVDMDFRLMEVEFALDIPQSTLSSNINFKKKGEVKSMARTPYEMMKIVILSGDYDREDYIHKVGKYYERGRMTKEEYDELMSLMTADEVIGG